MGSLCCGNVISDKELLKADNIDDIIKLLENRILLFLKEKDQIKQYLVDHKTEVDTIFVDDISDDNLKNRISYLAETIEVYGELINLLKNNKKLSVDMIKIKLNSIFEKYFLVYDPNDELLDELNGFRNFAKDNNN